MVMRNFIKALQGTSKVPRNQLDQCALLMKLCIEVKRQTDTLEEGTIKVASISQGDSFVDRACSYVTSVADTTSVVSANKRKEDWALVKKEAIDIAKTLPGDMNATLHSQLQNAEINGEKMAKKMEDVALVVGKGSKLAKVTLTFVSGKEEERKVTYDIKRRTPPSGLATMVLYKSKQEGSPDKGEEEDLPNQSEQGGFPNFYLKPFDKTYPLSPADWGPDEPTPLQLYVVMDKGRFEFHFKIEVLSPITETWVFRNLFSIKIDSRECRHLKDSRGMLHRAPEGTDRLDRAVQCRKVHHADRKRIKGGHLCSDWAKILEHILTDVDADWVVNAIHEQISPPTPSYDTTPLIPRASFIPSVYSIPSSPLQSPTLILNHSLTSTPDGLSTNSATLANTCATSSAIISPSSLIGPYTPSHTTTDVPSTISRAPTASPPVPPGAQSMSVKPHPHKVGLFRKLFTLVKGFVDGLHS